MVRSASDFSRGGHCETSSSSSTNDDEDSRGTKCEASTDSLAIGKKRPSSTLDLKTLDGTKKRSPGYYGCNEDNYIDNKTPMDTTDHDLDSSVSDLYGRNAPSEEDTLIEENIIDGHEEDSETNHWEEFVNAVESDAIPNLDAYVKAKALRNETTTRFVNAVDACLQTLNNTADEIVTEVVKPIYDEHLNEFYDAEESIIDLMVSNHTRRIEMLELMQNADDVWTHTYNQLTSEVMGQVSNQNFGMDDETIEEGTGKDVGENEEESTSQNYSKEIVSTISFSPEKKNENTIFGHEDSDWEELLEYEPSRERILSFLDQRVKRNEIMREFEESLDNIHCGIESEVKAILLTVSDLFNEYETASLEYEEEIEYLIMDNYERREILQEELEKSAKQVQGLFADLLSRLNRSAS